MPTLFDKIWDSHIVTEDENAPAVLYIDLHLVHEVTSPQAFAELKARGLPVRCPQRTVATMDHSTPTLPAGLAVIDPQAQAQLDRLRLNCTQHGIELHELGSEKQGIVHVVGPELGLTQPGMTVVCGDSHTATHGAFATLAFGIGTTEVAHVLATQSLLQRRPQTFEVRLEGKTPEGVVAKDIILALIQKIGVGGGTGHVLEYRGSAVNALDMEGRMTICNMSIEAGARAGMMAADDITFEYIAGREHAPQAEAFEKALSYWKTLHSDADALFDRSVTLDVSTLEPMITYGTHPGMGMPITSRIPDPATLRDPKDRDALKKALNYMDLTPGAQLLNHPIDVIFIGSCTNGRLADLRQAASVMKGRKVAKNVQVLVVPGSVAVKKQAEAEGLDVIFKNAGAEWRNAGCSMCIAMNGDALAPGQIAVSTSNRNFEGRQGKGSRTLLASSLTAAASAVTGKVMDVRQLEGAPTP